MLIILASPSPPSLVRPRTDLYGGFVPLQIDPLKTGDLIYLKHVPATGTLASGLLCGDAAFHRVGVQEQGASSLPSETVNELSASSHY